MAAKYTYDPLLIILLPLLNDTDQATPPVALLIHEDFAPTGVMKLSVNEV
jgi:hypothetical protein